MSIDAVFVNGPFLEGFSRESRSPAVTKSGTLYYPGWLAYACGYAEDKGYECKLYDCIADKIDEASILALIKEDSPRLVVIGTSTPSIHADCSFAASIKDLDSEIKTALVGTHASSTAREILEGSFGNAVDFIARREYDETITEVLGLAEVSPDSLSGVSGVSFRGQDGIVENENRPYLDNLDELPFASKVYKEHLTIENYYYGHVKYPMVSIWTSRGCDAKCNYCVYPQTMFGEFRHRSAVNIAKEFEWIAQNLPEVKEVLIDDDTFTMNPKHAREVCEELIKIGNKLPWTCEARATLDYKTLEMMKKAGCRLIVVGFESIHQDVLSAVKKGLKQTRVEKFVQAAKQSKLKIHGCFMAGNPGDTLEKLDATLDWALSHNFDTVQFFPLQLYPGTSAYDAAKADGFLEESDYRRWLTEDGLHNMTLIANDQGLTREQAISFCNEARRKFYLRPSYILRKSMDLFLDPVEFRKTVIGFLNIRKYLFAKS